MNKFPAQREYISRPAWRNFNVGHGIRGLYYSIILCIRIYRRRRTYREGQKSLLLKEIIVFNRHCVAYIASLVNSANPPLTPQGGGNKVTFWLFVIPPNPRRGEICRLRLCPPHLAMGSEYWFSHQDCSSKKSQATDEQNDRASIWKWGLDITSDIWS